MMRVAAMVVAALLGAMRAPAAADALPRIDLDAETMAYLAGAWETDAEQPGVDPMYLELSQVFGLEFERSGGMIFVADGESSQGWKLIDSARRDGDVVEIRTKEGLRWTVRVAPADGLIQLDLKFPNGAEGVLYPPLRISRVKAAERATSILLSSETVFFLSFLPTDSANFGLVDGRDDSCRNGRRLSFQLLEPGWPLYMWYTADDTTNGRSWDIRSASESDGVVRLMAIDREGMQRSQMTLHLERRGDRIRVIEWDQEFERCTAADRHSPVIRIILSR